MLRVRVEIVPYGMEDHPNRREVAEIIIGLRQITEGIGHYKSVVTTDGKGPQPPYDEVEITHPRKDGALRLVQACLNEHFGEST